jgi:hypothetical protein
VVEESVVPAMSLQQDAFKRKGSPALSPQFSLDLGCSQPLEQLSEGVTTAASGPGLQRSSKRR